MEYSSTRLFSRVPFKLKASAWSAGGLGKIVKAKCTMHAILHSPVTQCTLFRGTLAHQRRFSGTQRPPSEYE